MKGHIGTKPTIRRVSSIRCTDWQMKSTQATLLHQGNFQSGFNLKGLEFYEKYYSRPATKTAPKKVDFYSDNMLHRAVLCNTSPYFLYINQLDLIKNTFNLIPMKFIHGQYVKFVQTKKSFRCWLVWESPFYYRMFLLLKWTGKILPVIYF